MLNKCVFWWKSSSRHGIHSPFIYQFLDQGLYRKDLGRLPSQKRLLLAAADYFKPGRVCTSNPESGLAGWLGKTRPSLFCDETPYDFYLFDTPEKNLSVVLGQPELWHNNSVVFVGNIRSNRAAYLRWQDATRILPVRVILETYPAGLLFFRRQQARQHFKIRI